MSTTALSAVLAKLAGLNVAGKVAVGIAVAAGAIGAAPVVTHTVTGVSDSSVTVETTDDAAATPTTEATENATEDDATAEATENVTEDDATDAEDADGTQADLPDAAAFGQSVAEDARDGGVDGQQISEQARARELPAPATDRIPETPAVSADEHADVAMHAPAARP